MARWNQITGPASNFEMTTGPDLVTGFTINRSYGVGILLVSYAASITNGTAGAGGITLQALLDGSVILPSVKGITLGVNESGPLSFFSLVPIAPGFHTITLEAFGLVATGDIIQANRCILAVIELPAWDNDSFVVVL